MKTKEEVIEEIKKINKEVQELNVEDLKEIQELKEHEKTLETERQLYRLHGKAGALKWAFDINDEDLTE